MNKLAMITKSISSFRGAIKQYRATFLFYPLEVSQFAVPRYTDDILQPGAQVL